MQVINKDASKYLNGLEDLLPSVFTSIPDPEEIGGSILEYEDFFKTIAAKIMVKTDPDGYAIFYQTDRKFEGGIISKAHLLMQVAKDYGLKLIYHKICFTVEPGKKHLFRPGYTHLLCFSQNGTCGNVSPDVFHAGKKIYSNATGFNACQEVFSFLKKKDIHLVYDLFCGRGSIAYIGKRYFDIEVISVDIDPDQCKKTEELLSTITPQLI